MDDDVQAIETFHPSIAHLNGGGISFVVPDAGSSADIPGNYFMFMFVSCHITPHV